MNPKDASHRNRLWTPWRMRYITGDAREDGCIFCNRLAGDDDVTSLILHRAKHAFVIMNLFPYNTGHVMVVPNDHAADLDALDESTLVDMATLLPRLLAGLRRDLGCDGFNIGLNLGSVAGAGVAEHLHQHVVPRWEGDANFMPILAGTMVVPEMIPSTYAKIRVELARELGHADQVEIVPVSNNGAVWFQDEAIATIEPPVGKPVWRAAIETLGVDGAEVVGWAGGNRAALDENPPGLVVRVDSGPAGSGWNAVPAATARQHATARRALDQMAQWIGR